MSTVMEKQDAQIIGLTDRNSRTSRVHRTIKSRVKRPLT